jgi:hypothetical protein
MAAAAEDSAAAAPEEGAQAAEAAHPLSFNVPAICGGGKRAPGLDRCRRESLVGVAAPVRARTSLEPKAAQHAGARVQPEPDGPGILAARGAALYRGVVLPRGERRGLARVASRGERITNFRYSKFHEVSSFDRLLIGKQMFGLTHFHYDQLADLSPSLRHDDCLFKADIKDAYYHLRLREADQLYLEFRVGGIT